MESNEIQQSVSKEEQISIRVDNNILIKPIGGLIGKKLLNIAGIFMLILAIITLFLGSLLIVVGWGLEDNSAVRHPEEIFMFIVPVLLFVVLVGLGIYLNKKDRGSQLLIILSFLFYGFLIFLGLNYWIFKIF